MRNFGAQCHHLWPGEFDAIVKFQGGRCGVVSCGKSFSELGCKAFHVDHDHACCPGRIDCGECVRGILCWQCNRYLLPQVERVGLSLDYLAHNWTHEREAWRCSHRLLSKQDKVLQWFVENGPATPNECARAIPVTLATIGRYKLSGHLVTVGLEHWHESGRHYGGAPRVLLAAVAA